MRVLGHIHTFNSEDVIGGSVRGLLGQTYPLEEILIVDNGSTDGTLRRTFPHEVTIRQVANLGVSGAVATGFQYALNKDYDWIWVFDADTVPNLDGLQKLLQLYHDLSEETGAQIGILSSHSETSGGPLMHCTLTPNGPRPAKVSSVRDYYECDTTIWSGSLFNLKAIRRVGCPTHGIRGYWEGSAMDWGDIEFCYRVRQAGYRIVVHRYSIMNHTLGAPRQLSVFGKTLRTTNHPAYRRYLFFRNMVNFWLHVYSRPNLIPVTLFLGRRVLVTAAKILILEKERLPKLWASFRGVWDGLRGNICRQY